MADNIRHPIQAFLSWLDSLPVAHKKYLAQMFWICTTENTEDLVMNPDESLVKFKYYLLRNDFPLRMLIKMLTIKSVFDFILNNLKMFSAMAGQEGIISGSQGQNVSFLSEKQWEKTIGSWRTLTSLELSPKIFSLWLKKLKES